MPLYPIDCECGSIEGWSRRKLPSDATEVECFECDRVVPIGTLKASQLARVTGFGAPRTVPGLSGEFHSFGEIERAAAAVGGYVESDEEKKPEFGPAPPPKPGDPLGEPDTSKVDPNRPETHFRDLTERFNALKRNKG